MQKNENKFSYSSSEGKRVTDCDQMSIEHQPLEKSEKCIEISALVITYQSTDYWLLFINYSLLFDTTNNV